MSAAPRVHFVLFVAGVIAALCVNPSLGLTRLTSRAMATKSGDTRGWAIGAQKSSSETIFKELRPDR